MEQEKLLLQYHNNDLLLVNVENERCENKYENSIKDKRKQINMLTNGNFIILNAKKRMISQYVISKNAPVCSKYVRVDLNFLVFSKEETIIMGGDEKGVVYVWNRHTGRLINSFQAHYGSVNNIVIDQYINVVYTYGDEYCIHVYDLNDILSKKKIKTLVKYEHNICDRVKQIIPITPNIYFPYKTLISLTYSGSIYIFGLRSEYPTDIIKTKSENCNFICSNELFNTHLYLCKGNEIYRISLVDNMGSYEKREKDCTVSKTYRNYSNQEELREQPSEDFIKTRNRGVDIHRANYSSHNLLKEEAEQNKTRKTDRHQTFCNSDTDTDNCQNSSSSSDMDSNSEDDKILSKRSNVTLEKILHMKKCTIFIGHKNEVLKCNVNEKKNWLISLAKDGIRVWDLFHCYTIKVLKYGENIINFYVPSSKMCSYFIEFPNLVMEYEDEVKINIISEMEPHDLKINYEPFLKEESPLLNMAVVFSEKRI